MKKLFYKIIIKLMGDEKMMALLFAQRVILERNMFEEVPESLKPQVYQHLMDSGVEFLAGDYVPPEEP